MDFAVTTDEQGTLALTHHLDSFYRPNTGTKVTIDVGELLTIILNNVNKFDTFIKAMETEQKENFNQYSKEFLDDDNRPLSEEKRLNDIFRKLCYEHLPDPINYYFYTEYSNCVDVFMSLEIPEDGDAILYRYRLPEARKFLWYVKDCIRDCTELVSGKEIRYVGYAPSAISYEFQKDLFTEMVTIENFCNLPNYCLYLVLKNKIAVNKCQNCGKFFVPSSRSDEIYCDNIFKDGKTCKQIGYERKVNKDEYKKAYRTAYKTKNAAKNRKLKKSPTAEDDFKEWVSEAKKELEKAKAGEITLEEFKRWLKEGNTNGRH